MVEIDLRSDTKTLPTTEMLESISKAKLGDSLANEDPTVNDLESMAAELLGKEAAVLVTSGTQGNTSAVLAQCQRGSAAVVAKTSHIHLAENSGISNLGGIPLHTLWSTSSGSLDPDEVESVIMAGGGDNPKIGMVSLEDTQNREGGRVLNRGQLKEIADVAHRHNLPFHVDGARLFNAIVALGVDPAELVQDADTVTFCLSKGLSCPIGSILCGTSETIKIVRQWLYYMGGGMRQAGIIAAPGIVALNTMVERLQEDHDNAKRLAHGLNGIDGLSVQTEIVESNLVFAKCHVDSVDELANTINDNGVLFYADTSEELKQMISGANSNQKPAGVLDFTWRFVTHYGITRKDIEQAIQIVDDTVAKFN